MKRPGFRRTSRGAVPAANGPADRDASPIGAPFSQAQILHLMKAEFGRARRHGYSLACILMRIDRLERLTDRLGHGFRDVSRRRLGQLVAEKTRDHDHVGLVGDDSYLLILPHTTSERALPVAERIRRAFAELEFESDSERVTATISLGVAACEDRDTMFFETLVSQAELALERAGEAGGDRALVFRRELFASGPEDGPSDGGPGLW